MNVKMAVKLGERGGHRSAHCGGERRRLFGAAERARKAPRRRRRNSMWKCGAAKAALGGDLKDVQAVAQRRSTIVARSASASGRARCLRWPSNFTIAPGTTQVGIGHDGDPGARVEPLKPAAGVARDMVDDRPRRSQPGRWDRGRDRHLGPRRDADDELYILNDTIDEEIGKRGLKIARTYIGVSSRHWRWSAQR